MPASWQERVSALELANAEVAARLADQHGASERLDTKATTVLGFVVVAASFVFVHATDDWLLGVVGALYLFTFLSALNALRPRTYRAVPEPSGAITVYRNLLAAGSINLKEQFLAQLVATKAQAFEENRQADRQKVRWWWVSIGGLVLALTTSAFAVQLGTDNGSTRQRPVPTSCPRLGSGQSPRSVVSTGATCRRP
jgi:hypothetical protein